jgi:hypothetical protein
MIAPAEAGQDLIADRARIGRRRIDPVILVEKFDKATRAYQSGVGVSDVQNDQVHRNSAEEGKPLAADAARAAMAQRAEPAIGVADCNGGEASGLADHVGGAVADGLAAFDLADL